MPVDSTVTIVGVKETLRQLQKLEPDTAKAIKAEFKQIVKPIVDAAKPQIRELPLSGFARNWKGGKIMPWDKSAVQKSIIARFSNRKRGNSLAVFSVTMKSPAGTIFDMAGRASANRLAAALDQIAGKPSRLMWPTYERHADQVNENVARLVDKITDEANRRLVG
ncbi:MAG: hypothetical protein EBR82_41685 [Caulobacteraceae bacterium]|nr:hypothetical protein [Caulobacteraceae bacterium]